MAGWCPSSFWDLWREDAFPITINDLAITRLYREVFRPIGKQERGTRIGHTADRCDTFGWWLEPSRAEQCFPLWLPFIVVSFFLCTCIFFPSHSRGSLFFRPVFCVYTCSQKSSGAVSLGSSFEQRLTHRSLECPTEHFFLYTDQTSCYRKTRDLYEKKKVCSSLSRLGLTWLQSSLAQSWLFKDLFEIVVPTIGVAERSVIWLRISSLNETTEGWHSLSTWIFDNSMSGAGGACVLVISCPLTPSFLRGDLHCCVLDAGTLRY